MVTGASATDRSGGDRRTWAALTGSLRRFHQSAGRRLPLAVTLSLVSALGQGGAVLLLAPFLELLGIEAGQSAVTRRVERALEALGLGHSLDLLLGVYGALTVGLALLGRYQAVLHGRLNQEFVRDLRERFYNDLMRADWLTVSRLRAAEITQALMGDHARIAALANTLANGLVVVAVGGVQVVIAFAIAPVLTVAAAAAATAMMLTMHPFNRRARRLGREELHTNIAMFNAITEHNAAIKMAHCYGFGRRHGQAFSRVACDVCRRAVALTGVRASSGMMYRLGSLAALGGLVYLAVAVFRMPAGIVIIVFFLYSRILPMLGQLQQLWQDAACQLPAWEHAEGLHRRLRASGEPPPLPAPALPPGPLRLQQVTFFYNPAATGARAALENVTLTLPMPGRVAVIGPSGAGKSTLADLCLGLLSPTTGRVELGETPLCGAVLAAFRQHVAYVPQENFLFDRSVRDNLLWARPEADDADLHTALRDAAAEDFVMALPEGLDSMVGERGACLSAGQRQRLCLARALLRRPRLLVLDEAMSNLDEENEYHITGALERLRREICIIQISHRLHTIRAADLVVVLDRGRIIDQGPWDALVARGSDRFHQMMVEEWRRDTAPSVVADASVAAGRHEPVNHV